jgi:hypothetical protein
MALRLMKYYWMRTTESVADRCRFLAAHEVSALREMWFHVTEDLSAGKKRIGLLIGIMSRSVLRLHEQIDLSMKLLYSLSPFDYVKSQQSHMLSQYD